MSAPPRQAAAIELGEKVGGLQDLVAESDGATEGGGVDVADGGTWDGVVPDAADGVVEQHAHEAVVEADGPMMGGGSGGQRDAGEMQPRFDPAPLIVSLSLVAEDQARLDRLRDAYFPPERNFLAAHVTLFHHLPGTEHGAVAATLAEMCAGVAAFPVRVARLQSLGRGVALALDSDALIRLRAGLARTWAGWLTAQDRQGYRPHVTIQNKVEPAVAKALLAELSAGFSPWVVDATGMSLWRYRGGPWEAAGVFPFVGA